VWSAARSRVVTRFHSEPLGARDRAAIACSVAVALLAIAGRAVGWPELGYNPFAGLAWPPFALDGALVALATAWPAARLARPPDVAPSTAHPGPLATGSVAPP
jgi:hypothetical protein